MGWFQVEAPDQSLHDWWVGCEGEEGRFEEGALIPIVAGVAAPWES